MLKGLCVRACDIFSDTTGPVKVKFHAKPSTDKGIKFIQMVKII